MILKLNDPGVERFFRDFSRLGGTAVGWSGGGEPTLHPQFVKALEMAASADLCQGLFTHGVFPECLVKHISTHCEWVRVSIDTHNPTSYARRRCTKKSAFNTVMRNIEKLVDQHKTRVGLNMNVSEWNKGDIQPLFDLACKLNVAYLQIRPTLPTPFLNKMSEDFLFTESIPSIAQFLMQLSASRKKSDPELIVSWDKFDDLLRPGAGRNDPVWGYKGCAAHNLFVVLNYNGNLMVCMYHLNNPNFVLGNIYDTNTLEAIWQSCNDVRHFCSTLDNDAIGCQVCCKGHEINKILLSPQGKNLIFKPDRQHSNVFF